MGWVPTRSDRRRRRCLGRQFLHNPKPAGRVTSDAWPEGRRFESCFCYEGDPWDIRMSQGSLASRNSDCWLSLADRIPLVLWRPASFTKRTRGISVVKWLRCRYVHPEVVVTGLLVVEVVEVSKEITMVSPIRIRQHLRVRSCVL